MNRGCLVALCVGIGFLMLSIWGTGAFFAAEHHVDEAPVARHELSAAACRYIPEGAQNVWRAWYYCGQVSDHYLRFDMPVERMGEIESWLLSGKEEVRDLKKADVVGELPEWQIRDVAPPDWWQVAKDAKGVRYQFFRGRDYVSVLVLPAERRVWLVYFKV